MNNSYSKSQKNLIMLYGDLLGNPLTLTEKIEVQKTLASDENDISSTVNLLSSETKAKVKSLTSKGLKLSLELEKLSQRGIKVLFPKTSDMERLKNYFAYVPSLLFASGNMRLFKDEASAVSFSLNTFKNTGYTGIFIIDRPFDSLLCNNQIATALRNNQALLISDLVKSRATTISLDRDTNISDQQDEVSLPEKYVFISGSRSQSSIPKIVQNSLETIIGQGIGILIGDSNKGVDKEIIDFLRVPLYKHVIVYTISDYPRIEPEPEWNTRMIKADKSLKPQQRQMSKDRVMAIDADWGLAVFDPIEKNRYGALQVSSGTLRNTIQLLLQGKMVKFFYMYEGEMKTKNLKKLEDLESVIESYRLERLSSFDEKTILSSKGIFSNDNAAHVKSSKIMTKYKALLKNERELIKEDEKEDTYSKPIQTALPLFD